MSKNINLLVIETGFVIHTKLHTTASTNDVIKGIFASFPSLKLIEDRLWECDDESVTIRVSYKNILEDNTRIGNYNYRDNRNFFEFRPRISLRFIHDDDRSLNKDTPVLSFYVKPFELIRITSLDKCFSNSSIEYLDCSMFDTTYITTMACMFENCKNIKTLDLSKFDTRNLKDIHGMFKNCTSLELLNISTWDTSNVENMAETFADCQYLKSIDVLSWDMNKVTNRKNMFKNCGAILVG